MMKMPCPHFYSSLSCPGLSSHLEMAPWGYLGYEILFAIPLVGFILLLVFSFGGTRNINLRNFARSYFCALIIGLGVKAGQTAPEPKWRLPLHMVLGAVALYTLGTVWFMIQSGNGLAASLSMCVVPFIPADVIKIAAASLLAWPIRKAIY